MLLLLILLGRRNLETNDMFGHRHDPLEFQVSLTNLYALITRNHTKQPTSKAKIRYPTA